MSMACGPPVLSSTLATMGLGHVADELEAQGKLGAKSGSTPHPHVSLHTAPITGAAGNIELAVDDGCGR